MPTSSPIRNTRSSRSISSRCAWFSASRYVRIAISPHPLCASRVDVLGEPFRGRLRRGLGEGDRLRDRRLHLGGDRVNAAVFHLPRPPPPMLEEEEGVAALL